MISVESGVIYLLSSTTTISVAQINSRLDYCNSLLNNIPKIRLTCPELFSMRGSDGPRFSSSIPLFRQLHWLPVVYRIKFKLVTVTYRTISTQQPTYLVNLLHFSYNSKTFRSSVSKQRFVPKTKLNVGKRAFSETLKHLW